MVAQQELTEKVRSRLIKTVQILAAGRGENLSEWGTSGVIVDLKARESDLAKEQAERIRRNKPCSGIRLWLHSTRHRQGQ